ncbi:MAG: hypothetical protein E5W70_24390 [Mesorhizobium sp.]|nr:MAG: hypothetical protein E5W70_24390 [Mesorhizobium sp.]
MRGAPAWRRRHSGHHPSTVSALRADPPSPTRGEGMRLEKQKGGKRCATRTPRRIAFSRPIC